MDPFLAVAILAMILLTFGGIWGTIVISGLMKRRSNVLAPQDDARLKQLLSEQEQMDARLGKLEDEVAFLRELKNPDAPARLKSPE